MIIDCFEVFIEKTIESFSKSTNLLKLQDSRNTVKVLWNWPRVFHRFTGHRFGRKHTFHRVRYFHLLLS